MLCIHSLQSQSPEGREHKINSVLKNQRQVGSQSNIHLYLWEALIKSEVAFFFPLNSLQNA